MSKRMTLKNGKTRKMPKHSQWIAIRRGCHWRNAGLAGVPGLACGAIGMVCMRHLSDSN
jgi:hypothetical protein